MSLRKKTISGIKWTSASSIIVAIVQLGQLVILAHYLSPSDFGLMAIVTVVIGFSGLFMDMGISASIIHKQNITHEQLSSLYWVNIAAGLALFIVVYFSAPFLANFYNEEELVPIMRLLAVTFILVSFGNQYEVLLQKNLRFNTIAKISITATLTAFFVSILCAREGYGVYALVYGSLASVLVGALLYVSIGLKNHKPSLLYHHKDVLPMLSFGLFQMGERSINYFNSQFDVVLIGKLLGVEALGIYTVAKNLAMRPAQVINPIITKVTFPVMSTVQEDIEKLKNIYLKTINYLASINFPIYALVALLAEPIVMILFGSKWQDSIVILQILSLYGAMRSIGNPVGSLLLAKGRANLGFYWNLVLFLFIPVSIYIGSNWGIVGISYAMLIVVVLSIVPSWHFLVNPLCGMTFKTYMIQIVRPLVFAIIGGVVAYVINFLFGIENFYIKILSTSLIMGIVVYLLNARFNRDLIEILFELFGIKNNNTEGVK